MDGTQALALVAKLVAGRDKTRAQVEQALERKGCTPDVVRETIERARALGYLDDARVAARLAGAALEDGWVGEALEARLLTKGLDEAAVTAGIARAREELAFDDEAAARRLIGARRLTGAKAARLLASHGFDEDLVARLVGTEGADG